MLSRLQILWPCIALLCVACSLDSSPRSQGKSSGQKDEGDSWKPPATSATGSTNSGRGITSDTDASKSDASEAGDAATSAASEKDGGAAQAPAQTPSAPPSTATTGGAGSQPQPAGGPAVGSAGAAVDGAAVDGAAGSAGGAGAGGDPRDSLADAADEALGESPDGGMQPWRNGGGGDGEGEGLSADFVKSVLFSMVASGQCRRDRQSCFQVCFVISTDCKPCSEDADCADMLKAVCGWFGTCNLP